MNLPQYFQKAEGIGILATADAKGNVDIAIYEKPQVIDDKTIALNMTNRLSYKNLSSNPHAAYMFIENTTSWDGKRLYLTKTGQISGTERIRQLRAAGQTIGDPAQASKNYVTFTVDKIRPAVGDHN